MERYLPTRAEAAMAALTGIAALGVPLLRTLGYESAMLLAVLAAALAVRRGMICGRGLRAAQAAGGPRDTSREASGAFVRATAATLGAAFLTFAVILLWTRLVQGCRVGPGTVMVLFLVPPAAAHFAALGLLLGSLFRRLAWALAGLGAVAALHIAHVASQVLSGGALPHSLPFGFLSASGWGGIGSTGLDLPASYFMLRALAVACCPLLTLLAGLACCRGATGGALRPRRATARAVTLAAAPVVAAVLFPAAFGLTTGVARRERALPGRTRTAHVVVRFSPGGPVAAEAPRVAEDAEWDFQVIAALMKLGNPRPVTVWLYEDGAQMRRLTGADEFLFGLPWRREVHTIRVPEGAASLRHELVHVLAADWSGGIFGLCWNQALLEGTAEAIASYAFLGGDFQKTAAAALGAGHLPKATKLFRTTGFAWGQGSLRSSYKLAGSFVGFLMQRYGVGSLSRAYRGETWERSFGRSLAVLDGEWRRLLDDVPVSTAERENARSVFDPVLHPAFFRTRCPRVGLALPRGEGGGTGGGPREAGGSPGSDRRGAALRLTDAARRSGSAADVRDAARAMTSAGLAREAYDRLRGLSEGAVQSRESERDRLEIRRQLFLLATAAPDRAGAEALLRQMENDAGVTPGAREFYGMVLGSAGGTSLASALLLRLEGPDARNCLREALRADPGGPAALIAAEKLCSWPPAGTHGAAPRLYAAFLASRQEGELAAEAGLKMGRLSLRSGDLEEARIHYERALAGTRQPRNRVEAAEGLARSQGWGGRRFVNETLPPFAARATMIGRRPDTIRAAGTPRRHPDRRDPVRGSVEEAR